MEETVGPGVGQARAGGCRPVDCVGWRSGTPRFGNQRPDLAIWWVRQHHCRNAAIRAARRGGHRLASKARKPPAILGAGHDLGAGPGMVQVSPFHAFHA